ncbi:MAG: mechanosensitive ion channel family protein [Thermoanaerobaculia bacterium]
MSDLTWVQWFEPWIERVSDRPGLRMLIILAVALVVAKLAAWLVGAVARGWAARTKTDFDDRLVEILHRPIFVSVLLAGFWLAAVQVDPQGWPRRLLVGVLTSVAILVWLVFALQLAGLLLGTLSSAGRRFGWVDQRTLPLFDNLAKGLLIGAAVYFLFLAWGVDVAGWMVSAGVVGIAVGFAAKDTLANLFSGLFILADAPYKLGDFIVLDTGERGEVTHIGLRSTRILTRDDVEITIPNAVIAGSKITNESGGPAAKQRLRVKVGVAYGSDIDRVRAILTEVALREELVVEQPEPRVRMRGFGDSSLDFELLCWVELPVQRGQALDQLYTAVYKRFQAEGVEIPFPQRDVWIRAAGSAGEPPES